MNNCISATIKNKISPTDTRTEAEMYQRQCMCQCDCKSDVRWINLAPKCVFTKTLINGKLVRYRNLSCPHFASCDINAQTCHDITEIGYGVACEYDIDALDTTSRQLSF
jgi:hypothetical protein